MTRIRFEKILSNTRTISYRVKKQALFSSTEETVFLGRCWFSIVFMAFSIGLVVEKYWFSIMYIAVCQRKFG